MLPSVLPIVAQMTSTYIVNDSRQQQQTIEEKQNKLAIQRSRTTQIPAATWAGIIRLSEPAFEFIATTETWHREKGVTLFLIC